MNDRGIVPSADRERGIRALGKIHGHLLLIDRGRRLHRKSETHGHTVGNAAADAAVVVRFRHHTAAVVIIRIVCLAAAHIRDREAGAEFHALHAADGEECVREHALKAVEPGLADTRRQADDLGLENAANAVTALAGRRNMCLHSRLRLAGNGGKFRRVKHRAAVLRECLVRNIRHTLNVRVDINAVPSERRLHKGARCNHRRRHSARKMAAAAGILEAVVFFLCRIVRVSGARRIAKRIVVAAVLALILDHEAKRRARGPAADRTAEDPVFVGLAACRARARLGLSLIKSCMYEILIDCNAGCKSVQNGADRAAVALAEKRDAEGIAECVFHIELLSVARGDRKKVNLAVSLLRAFDGSEKRVLRQRADLKASDRLAENGVHAALAPFLIVRKIGKRKARLEGKRRRKREALQHPEKPFVDRIRAEGKHAERHALAVPL